MKGAAYAPRSSSNGEEEQRLEMDGADPNLETGGRFMLSAILSLTLVVIVISVHLCIRYRRHHPADYGSSITVLRPTAAAPTVSIRGLKASAIAALPTFIFRDGAADCAVCISAAEEGEMMRMLPGCMHVFHAGCIDMWLHSHSTCPVCRREAKPAAEAKIDQFGELLAAPRLAERVGGGGWRAMGNAGSGRWAAVVDGGGNQDLERQ